MSVGKTTLVNALKELNYFKGYNFRTERSKELMAQGIHKYRSTYGSNCFLAERASELMHENIITDRTVIDVIAFARASKSMNYLDKEDFTDYAKHLIREYDYIFYVSPEGVEIEDNGIRETDAEYRKEIDMIIDHTIMKNRHRIKNLIKISGSTEERMSKIISSINS